MPIVEGGRISYIFVRVFDLERMIVFYRDTLGFRLLHEENGVCGFLGLPGAPHPQIALYGGRETSLARGMDWFFIIDVDDLKATAARIAEQRIATAGIFEVPYGRAIQITDPEGNLIQFHQPT